jgi:hypothetical protein
MGTMKKKSFLKPDEVRTFEKGKLELVTIGTITFGRATFQPGWKWSVSVKPLVNTKSCEAPHLQYHVSGRLHVVMDDGSEDEFVPGDVSLLPPGHDGWVVGDEPVVVIDITGMADYAK